MMNDGQYHWFSEDDLNRLREALNDYFIIHDSNAIASAVQTELKVSSVRSGTVGIDVMKLQNALGLENGSKPLWLTDEENDFVRSLLS